MNLFYDPSILALRQLVDTASYAQPVHNIAVDFDGEVIIDPEKHYPGVALHKYKFCTQINETDKSKDSVLLSLYKTLVGAFNGNHHHISRNSDYGKAA